MGFLGFARLQAQGGDATRGFVAQQLLRGRIGFGGPVQHQHLTQEMDRGAIQRFADGRLNSFTRGAIFTACAYLDQAVRSKRAVDFLDNGVGQALIADLNNRTQGVGGSAQGAAEFGLKF